MMEYDIILDKMQLGTNTSDCGDITIENWDKKSFCLNDYVKFHILLKRQSTEEEKDTSVDVTAYYSITARSLNGTQTKDNSICFRNVQVTYSRLADVQFKGEEVLS
ncbi:hypothetical protein [uncultured Phocaeicola sp.]|uniref:hypothetical protein n=1 Tax=uncultured Phocaeicola sp. TaxID=990718 RepID=UPI0025E9A5BD|nr:hypothetical protein [uncultured Phocaeicola sp.]